MGKKLLNKKALTMLAKIHGFDRAHCGHCQYMTHPEKGWCAKRKSDPAPEATWLSDKQVCGLWEPTK